MASTEQLQYYRSKKDGQSLAQRYDASSFEGRTGSAEIDEDLAKTTVTKNKGIVSISIPTAMKFNLVLDKANSFTRVLGGTALFRQQRSDEMEFDQFFSLTVYRDDVMSVIHVDASLRRKLLMLAKETPGFLSLSYGKASLSLRFRPGSSKASSEEDVRRKFAVLAAELLAPFGRLPADTAAQMRARWFEIFATVLPYCLMPLIVLAPPFFDAPIAAGGIPWNEVMLATIVFAVLQILFLFCMTKQGASRIQGCGAILFVSVFSALLFVPSVVRGINAHAIQSMQTEIVEVEGLYKVERKKAQTQYFVLLADPSARLVVGQVQERTSLEVTRALYTRLVDAHVRQGSHVKIEEAKGLLGLPFVAQITSIN